MYLLKIIIIIVIISPIMFLFGGGSSKPKKDDSKKSKESQEIKDLKKRAKEAQKKRESMNAHAEIMSSTEKYLPVSSPHLNTEDAKLFQVYDVFKFQLSSNNNLIEGDVLLERQAKP
jgi:hypothetical protein